MKTISFTDFRKKASSFITEVEHGETLVILRQGKPVAEIIPYKRRHGNARGPVYKLKVAIFRQQYWKNVSQNNENLNRFICACKKICP